MSRHLFLDMRSNTSTTTTAPNARRWKLKLRNLKLGVIGAVVQIPLSVWKADYNKDEN